MGKMLSTQQVSQMVDYLQETIDFADQTLTRPDATLHEIALATRIKLAANSYIGLLSSIPSSELDSWFPVIKVVAIEILKKLFES